MHLKFKLVFFKEFHDWILRNFMTEHLNDENLVCTNYGVTERMLERFENIVNVKKFSDTFWRSALHWTFT